LSFRASQVYNI